jgi:molybdopterin-synthase adenylyltransferase
LRCGRVLVVGVGGLGCPAALSLAAARVGVLGLIDCDAVDLSNLHRQIIYRTTDLGRRKVAVAAERIARRYSGVALQVFDQRLSADNVADIFRQFDFVIDGTDEMASKYLVNDGAVVHRIAFSHAGVLGFQGQTMTVLPGRSACVRCLFPLPPPTGDLPTCQEVGVIGAVAGSIGVVQATEAVKYLLGIDTLLTNRLLTYDALSARWRVVPLSRRGACPVCGDQPTIQHPQLVEAAGASRSGAQSTTSRAT